MNNQGLAAGSVHGTVERADSDTYMFDTPANASRLHLLFTTGPSTALAGYGGIYGIVGSLANLLNVEVQSTRGDTVARGYVGTGDFSRWTVDVDPSSPGTNYCLTISVVRAASDHAEIAYVGAYAFQPA